MTDKQSWLRKRIKDAMREAGQCDGPCCTPDLERAAREFASRVARLAIQLDRGAYDVRHIRQGRELTGPECVSEALAAAERDE